MIGGENVDEPKPKGFVGFRIIEIPLGIVREMVAKGQGGDGAQKLVDDTMWQDDLSAVSVNEFDGTLTIVKDEDGRCKKLTKASLITH